MELTSAPQTTVNGRSRERGAALVEAAITIPLLLFVAVGIFEFGRAYQTWQVLTNAARESARYAVTPTATESEAITRARDYMNNGALPGWETATVTVNSAVPLAVGMATTVTIGYPFEFQFMQPIANFFSGTGWGEPLMMSATATMRNE